MKNIFLDGSCFRGGRVFIEGENYHYLRNVRRLGPGGRLTAVIENDLYDLVVEDVSTGRIACSIAGKRTAQDGTGTTLSVYQGLLKARRMDFVVPRLSELGVSRFVPLITERTVPDAAGEHRVERWMKLAREGAKVSGTERCMEVFPPLSFGGLSRILRKVRNAVIIVFSTDAGCIDIRSFLESRYGDGSFHLFYGPEGGFSSLEMEALAGLGGVQVSMGPLVLRSETAAIVGTGFIRLFRTRDDMRLLCEPEQHGETGWR